MKTTLPVFARIALAAVASASVLAAPAFAQAQAQGSSGADRGADRSGGSGSAPAGGPHANSAPSAPSGGGSSAPATGGGGGATGGYGVSRGGERSGGGDARATGGSGTSSGGGYTGSTVPSQGAGGRQGTGRATPRDGSGAGAGTGTGNGTADGVPTYARPRDGHTPVGTAVPRGTVPMAPTGGGGGIYNPGYYGGYGYDPWGYGYGGTYGGGYTGYYGGYYDPWYGGYPTYPQSTYTSSDEGSLKLKIKPRDAEVYVDGYFVGVVDDFDGIFQRLHIESGAHRIEVRANGFAPLEFEVRITPEHTTTYTGELRKIQ
jgi:PEGA domain